MEDSCTLSDLVYGPKHKQTKKANTRQDNRKFKRQKGVDEDGNQNENWFLARGEDREFKHEEPDVWYLRRAQDRDQQEFYGGAAQGEEAGQDMGRGTGASGHCKKSDNRRRCYQTDDDDDVDVDVDDGDDGWFGFSDDDFVYDGGDFFDEE